eukprot:c8410_g1_i3.p1 GENE.c8410_g1_i3~~c8410_g1_i3.p1  ORF type:complete len:236 (-),score=47.42 c8410_g1_i3:42-704(-)
MERECVVVLCSVPKDLTDAVEVDLGVSVSCVTSLLQVLTRTGINFTFATVDGQTAVWRHGEAGASEWVADHHHALHPPASLIHIARDVDRYSCLIIPEGLGLLWQLPGNSAFTALVTAFPICCIGHGVCGLGVFENDVWAFADHTLTGTPAVDDLKLACFSKLPMVVEDYATDHGGTFVQSSSDTIHVIVDRNLVTAQNVRSTALAVNNMVWLLEQSGRL